MRIVSIRHKGIIRFVERGDPSALPPAFAGKIAAMVTLLAAIQQVDELALVAKWHVHRLTGDRKGVWSFSVSRNWRLTFRCNEERGEIYDLDFEDYH